VNIGVSSESMSNAADIKKRMNGAFRIAGDRRNIVSRSLRNPMVFPHSSQPGFPGEFAGLAADTSGGAKAIDRGSKSTIALIAISNALRTYS
jgi:hypothetical protein